jgi:shikimate kinase
MLAAELHLQFYDADHEVEKSTGASVAWIFDLEGEAGFRKRESKAIEQLTQLHHIVLATGGGAVLDANNRHYLKERGTVIYLQAELPALLERTSRNQNRPLLAQNAEQQLQRLLKEREPLYRQLADYVYDTTGHPAIKIVQQIIADLPQFK